MKKLIVILIWCAVGAQAGEKKLVSRLYADRTARTVGDLITVQIEEQSSFSKAASDSRDKSLSGSAGFSLPGLKAGGTALWEALALPDWSVSAAKSFGSTGSKANTDTFEASITVGITEVLPNGNLLISGDRKVNIDGDIIKFTLSGMVRPDDISRANAVSSSHISGASITYVTEGEFSRNHKKGVVSRIVDWIIPF